MQHAKYEAWADQNYLRTIPLRAPRGVLFDRTGRVLVENRDSFTIVLLRERTRDFNRAIARLAEAVGWPEERVREPIQRAIARRDPTFRPIPVVEHATMAQVVAVKARQLELPEVEVLQVPMRRYPDDSLAAHVFGYVGEIRDDQLGRPEYAGLEPGALVGQTGLERVYNADADGRRRPPQRRRQQRRPRDSAARPGRPARRRADATDDRLRPAEGARGRVSRGRLQRRRRLSRPDTGEILAMTSLPAYDPNVFAGGIDRTAWAGLIGDPLNPMTNRLIQGKYAPGSMFKIVTAIAALGEGVITPDFKVNCHGRRHVLRPVLPVLAAHGVVDLRHAIEQSCNTFFYTLGSKLSIDTIYDYATKLGLVGKTGIDLPGEADSLVPSTEWKQREFSSPGIRARRFPSRSARAPCPSRRSRWRR